MRKEHYKSPRVSPDTQLSKKNPIMYNKKFDREPNPITNWQADPCWLLNDGVTPEEQEWFRLANEGKPQWDLFFFKTYRRHKGHWVWLPYESFGRTRQEALDGLITAIKCALPMIDSWHEEYNYLLKEILIIDRNYYHEMAAVGLNDNDEEEEITTTENTF